MLTLKTNTTANDPENNIPFLEKDYAIIRGATKALIDFSHPDTFYGEDYEAVSIPAETSIQNMVADSDDMATVNEFPAGTVSGTITPPGVHSMRMPKDKLAMIDNRNLQTYVLIVWVDIKADGYPNSENNNVLIFGDSNNTANNYGRLAGQFDMTTDNATLANLTFSFFGCSLGLSSEALSSVLSPGMCQLALVLERESSTSATISVFVDTTLVQSEVRSMTEYDDTDRGGDYFSLGDIGAFNDQANTRQTFGRLNLADLSGQSMTGADYIARDWNHARGFFGL